MTMTQNVADVPNFLNGTSAAYGRMRPAVDIHAFVVYVDDYLRLRVCGCDMSEARVVKVEELKALDQVKRHRTLTRLPAGWILEYVGKPRFPRF